MFRVVLLLTLNVTAMFLLVLLLGNRFVFYPSVYPEGRWDHDGVDGGIVDETFTTDDGVRLHGWWVPAETETAHTLLWMHGNSGNVTHRLEDLRTIHGYGVNVFLFDYRGYGKSEGSPDEEGVYRDARAAYDHVRKRIPEEDLYLFGRSLGGGVAVKLATEVNCGGLILQSTFTSIRDMSGASLPIPLLYLVLRTEMNSLSRIASVDEPILMIHGVRDDVVPDGLGRRLFDEANDPKYWLEVEEAGHDDLIETAPDRYRSTLLRFLENPEALCERDRTGRDQ